MLLYRRQLDEAVSYVAQWAESALDEMRQVILQLQPEVLKDGGLIAGIEMQACILERHHHMNVECNLGNEPDLPMMYKEALYCVLREVLHNIVKHSQASRVRLYLDREGACIRLQIEDNGVGFDPKGSFPGHLGLQSMRERLQQLSGTLEIVSSPGRGTSTIVQIPVPPIK